MKYKDKFILLTLSMITAFILGGCAGYYINYTEDKKPIQTQNQNNNNISGTQNPYEIYENIIDIDNLEIGTGTEIEEYIDSRPLIEKIDEIYKSKEKIAYLTFDDGPSPQVTPRILDILKEYNIKATFFVIGVYSKQYPDIIWRIHSDGHQIANHSYTHNYAKIYKNAESFMDEINATDEVLKNILGNDFNNKLFRFPGGSVGGTYDKVKKTYKNTLVENGYMYVDWNALNGDSEAKNVSKQKQLQNITRTATGKNSLVVLMHDANDKKTTIEALPDIIQHLSDQGYKFEILPNN